MKWSTMILWWMGAIVFSGMLASNIILKKQYDQVDKNDIYWTYGIVNDQPFKYLEIEGGNMTKILFEQSPHCSLRVLHDWQRAAKDRKLFESFVSNDTLYVKMIYTPQDGGERNWFKYVTIVRIFAPELLSVTGHDTRFEMDKMKQKNFHVTMSGKSSFEIESFDPDFDSVGVNLRDSSEAVFEMSPEYIPARESMNIKSLSANLQNNSILDVGHAQVGDFKLHIEDSAAIVLSGEGLKMISK
ncbi:MAG TPA: hypothetical protein VKR32_14250 [Puia sp.]|nr:hypothetical protein [Puia sp.]